MPPININRTARLNAERREVILEAARNVFDQKGLRGSSIRAIAAAAGCTTGAIYPYFKGKEEIYAEVLGQSLTELQSYIIERAEIKNTKRNRFLAFIDFYCDRPTDFSLGLYLYENNGAVSLGKTLNTRLNKLLVNTVKLVSLGDTKSKGSATEEALILAVLMGIIVTYHSRRMSLFNAEPSKVVSMACQKLFGDQSELF